MRALRDAQFDVRHSDWDIALDLGDLTGAQGTPKDAEGQEIVRQFVFGAPLNPVVVAPSATSSSRVQSGWRASPTGSATTGAPIQLF